MLPNNLSGLRAALSGVASYMCDVLGGVNGNVGEKADEDEADGFRGCGGVRTVNDTSPARDGDLGESVMRLERDGVLVVAEFPVDGRTTSGASSEGPRVASGCTVRRVSDGERGNTAGEAAVAGAVVGRGSCSCRLR